MTTSAAFPRFFATIALVAALLGSAPSAQADGDVSGTISSGSSMDSPTADWSLDRLDSRSPHLDGRFTPSNAVRGAGVDVYVVDSHVSADPELAGRLKAGATISGRSSRRCNTHGTTVATLVAGSTLGSAPQAKIIPVAVGGTCGGVGAQNLIEGIEWATEHHQTGVPAVMNISIEFYAADYTAINEAVDRAVADGITVVVAAGNRGTGACNGYPSSSPSAITVGGTTWAGGKDRVWKHSNTGACVDLLAPAVDVAAPDTTRVSGTSFAAPRVAGAAAVLLSNNPTMSPAEVRDVLVARSTKNRIQGVTSGTPNRLLFLG